MIDAPSACSDVMSSQVGAVLEDALLEPPEGAGRVEACATPARRTSRSDTARRDLRAAPRPR